MDITTKKGRRGRKDIDRIIVEKGRRGDFSPLQPDHYHSFYEIFYLWSGSCRFLLKDTVYQMEAGDLVFIAPGELHHSLYSAGEVCEIVMIYFKEEYLHLSDLSADGITSIRPAAAFLHGQRSRGIPGGAALPADPDAHREFPVRPLLRAF